MNAFPILEYHFQNTEKECQVKTQNIIQTYLTNNHQDF